jgi:ribosomal protein S18 acetylase RimI-like enzyme
LAEVKPAIRRATAADYDALCLLFEQADALHRRHLPRIFRQPDGPARDREYLLGLIAAEDAGLFIAEVEGRPVGLICVVLRESPAVPILVPRRYAVVDTVVVDERFRRAGIGRALMEHPAGWAAAQGAESIELNVWEFNREAIAFYERLGYRTASRRMSKRPHEPAEDA